MKTKTMVLCAIFAAILCIFSVMSIPIGAIPISMGLFGVMLTAVILGPVLGTISVGVFILLGLVGLPVFSGFKGGFQVLAGPTGGYIWSYILVALFIGLFAKLICNKQKSTKDKWITLNAKLDNQPHILSIKLPKLDLLKKLEIFIICLVGVAICYAAGTVQFMAVSDKNLTAALAVCVIPFIPFDIAKAIIATAVGYTVNRTLKKAGMLNK